MGRFSHKSIIINRMDLPEEKQHFHPFSEHLYESEYDCTYQRFVFVMWCVSMSPSRYSPQGHCSQSFFPSMLCYRQAAIYNNQPINQQVLPGSQQLLQYQTQIPASLCNRHLHICRYSWADGGTEGELEKEYSSLCSICVVVVVDPLVWLGGR